MSVLQLETLQLTKRQTVLVYETFLIVLGRTFEAWRTQFCRWVSGSS